MQPAPNRIPARAPAMCPPLTLHLSLRRAPPPMPAVLGRFVHTLNAFCKEKYGMEHSVSDYWVYEFAKIWHCDTDRSNHIVHDFFKSEHFNDGIPIIPGELQPLPPACLSPAAQQRTVSRQRQRQQRATLALWPTLNGCACAWLLQARRRR